MAKQINMQNLSIQKIYEFYLKNKRENEGKIKKSSRIQKLVAIFKKNKATESFKGFNSIIIHEEWNFQVCILQRKSKTKCES